MTATVSAPVQFAVAEGLVALASARTLLGQVTRSHEADVLGSFLGMAEVTRCLDAASAAGGEVGLLLMNAASRCARVFEAVVTDRTDRRSQATLSLNVLRARELVDEAMTTVDRSFTAGNHTFAA